MFHGFESCLDHGNKIDIYRWKLWSIFTILLLALLIYFDDTNLFLRKLHPFITPMFFLFSIFWWIYFIPDLYPTRFLQKIYVHRYVYFIAMIKPWFKSMDHGTSLNWCWPKVKNFEQRYAAMIVDRWWRDWFDWLTIYDLLSRSNCVIDDGWSTLM